MISFHFLLIFRFPTLAKEKAEKTFAFTYMNIMKDDGSIIKDGIHEFYVYKVCGRPFTTPKTM